MEFPIQDTGSHTFSKRYWHPPSNEFRTQPGVFLTENKKWLYVFGGKCPKVERLRVDFLQEADNDDKIVDLIPEKWEWENVEFKN